MLAVILILVLGSLIPDSFCARKRRPPHIVLKVHKPIQPIQPFAWRDFICPVKYTVIVTAVAWAIGNTPNV